MWIGVDDGHAEIKVYQEGKPPLKIPATVRTGGVSKIALRDDADIREEVYQIDAGDLYTAGEHIKRPIATSHDDYCFSEANRILVHHALRSFGLNWKNDDVEICTGLPIKLFYSGTEVNQDMVREKIKNLLKNDVTPAGRREDRITISKHIAVPEGVGAWMDYTCSWKASEENGMYVEIDDEAQKTPMGIVDIGGRTTDIAVVDEEGALDMEFSSTIDAGILSAVQHLKERIDIQKGTRNALNDDQARAALQTGHCLIWGETHEIKSIVSAVLDEVLEDIKGEVMRCLSSSGAQLSKILFVGGGAAAFGKKLKLWYPKNGMVVKDPEFANARGFQKFLALQTGG